MWQWLERWLLWLERRQHRYWIAYYLAYVILLDVLVARRWPVDTLEEWSVVITVALGWAILIAISVEGIVTAVLLIPATFKSIRFQERQRGRQEERIKWEAWVKAKEAAISEGREFTEPSPAERGEAQS